MKLNLISDQDTLTILSRLQTLHQYSQSKLNPDGSKPRPLHECIQCYVLSADAILSPFSTGNSLRRSLICITNMALILNVNLILTRF